jgi:hypothetical protein
MFKTAIFLLKEKEEKIVGLPFEELINYLGDISKSELFTRIPLPSGEIRLEAGGADLAKEMKIYEKYKDEMKKLKVTNRLITMIESDYDRIRGRVENIGKNFI